MNTTIVTPVSHARLTQDRIVLWEYMDGARVDLEKAQQEVDAVGQLLMAHDVIQCRLLIDIRRLKSISRDARNLFASPYCSHYFGVQALGLVVRSRISRMIGNIYMSINRPLHPTRLFTSTEEAQQWLLSFPLNNKNRAPE